MIVECWGLGLTAEETREYIHRTKKVMMGLATVYRHRHSLTAQQIIDELIRKQMRDIAKEDSSDIRMKYRDKLLEKFIPQRIEAYQKSVHEEKREVTINVDGFSPEERRFAEHLARKYIKANNQAEPSSIH